MRDLNIKMPYEPQPIDASNHWISAVLDNQDPKNISLWIADSLDDGEVKNKGELLQSATMKALVKHALPEKSAANALFEDKKNNPKN